MKFCGPDAGCRSGESNRGPCLDRGALNVLESTLASVWLVPARASVAPELEG